MSELEENILLLEDDFELIENALYESYVIGKAKVLSNALKNVLDWARKEVENEK